jgi:hypothetical protein
MTFKPLTADRGEELLTLYLAAFPVRTSAPQERAQESMEPDPGCGHTWQELLARYDPASSSWRTPQFSLLEDSIEFSETWPRWGLMRDGVSYQQQTLVPHTKEIVSGLWPTPRAQEPARTTKGYGRGLRELVEGKQQIEKWPTPIAQDAKHSGYAQSGPGKADKLSYAVVRWPTPQAHNAKETNAPNEYLRNAPSLTALIHTRAKEESEELAGGKLNPTWVEKLMGWPDDWTSLQPISHVKMCFWFMGMHDGTETGTIEVLRMLRNGDATQEVQRAIGRSVGIPETAFLLAELCEHANRFDEARVFMACAEALEEEVRGVQLCDGSASSSHRPEQNKQRIREHPDAMQALSRLLAHYGQEAWKSGSWEDAIPRVANGVSARMDRLKATGNGQVSLVAATAWSLLK